MTTLDFSDDDNSRAFALWAAHDEDGQQETALDRLFDEQDNDDETELYF